MIGGNTRLQHGEDEDLAVATDLEDGSTAIADVQEAVTIECDSSRHPHALRVRSHRAVLRNPVYRAIETRRDVQTAGAVERQAGRIHHLVHKRFDVVAGIDPMDGDRNLLPT